MAYRVVYTDPFEEEYDLVVGYLVETLRSPQAARDLVNGLDRARDALSENPYLRAVSRKPILQHQELREYYVKNYVIVYRVEGECVYLMHLYHQRQDFENLI